MEVFINDMLVKLEEGTTLSDLLLLEGISERYIAVAIDQTIIKCQDWKIRVLKDGDRIIVIGAIKGG